MATLSKRWSYPRPEIKREDWAELSQGARTGMGYITLISDKLVLSDLQDLAQGHVGRTYGR